MKNIGVFTLLFTFIFGLGLQAHGSDCGPKSSPGDKCEISLTALHPTQASVGLKEVVDRADKLRDMKRKKRDEYVESHEVPVVKGPGAEFYLVDGHHFVLAVSQIGYDSIPVTIEDDLSSLSPSAFWREMIASGKAYLYDAQGERLPSPAYLPPSIFQMQNDPYRSLAWGARKRGCFEKSDAFYSEFSWANFLRKRIDVGRSDKDFDRAVEEALKICHTKEARDLPGWTPR